MALRKVADGAPPPAVVDQKRIGHERVVRFALGALEDRHAVPQTGGIGRQAGIDAVSVLAFNGLNDLEDFLVSEDGAAIQAAETRLTGNGSEWWTAINYGVINRLMPELATEVPR